MSPPKVLHCVERMHTNAIESWLVRMHRHALLTGRAVDWYFHVQISVPGQLEASYPECAGRVIRSRCPVSDWSTFSQAFYDLCRSERYDAVHVHADLMSAPYLVAARLAGVRRNIVHVHNADETIPTPNALKQAILRPLLRRVCLSFTNRIAGISNHTLDTFLAGRPRRAGRDIVHYYGIEPPTVREEDVDPGAFRRSLDLSEDSRILLFAGRMVPEKNPLFALDVLAEMIHLDSKVAGVFVGSGSLDAPLAARAAELGLQSKFRALGWRTDVPAIMRCCDWFILPRPEQPMEGFGIAVVEAQLAGLRLLLSKGIADDPLLPTAIFRRLSLGDSAQAWAEAATDMLAGPTPSSSEAIKALQASPMDMDRALAGLLALYE